METEKFAEDSPLGLGWIMRHVSLDDAVSALEESSGLSRSKIMERYGIDKADLA